MPEEIYESKLSQRLTHAGYSEPQPPEGGFMTRVARWFGLGGPGSAPRDQQLSASGLSYAYPKPAQHFTADGKPCGLCNKYPWVPMFGQQHQQHQQQQHHQHQQQPLAQASQHRQRAVQFQAPPQSVFLPISLPVPGLSHVAMPPLYNAQPFRPLPQPQAQPQQPHLYPLENVGAHSELRPVPAVPSTTPQPPPRQSSSSSSSSSFEIVQSHQLTDFVTSVEYPATYVQSHAIDLGQTATATPTHQQQQQQQQQQQELDISTVRYQLEDLSSGAVHQHLPASQLLTELGHFTPITVETPTTQIPAADNYPAASSQQQQQHEEEQEQQHLYYAEQYQDLTETSTVTPVYESLVYTTEQPAPAPSAAVELNNHLVSHGRDGRQRETPKRLLDSPINHGQAHGAPPPRPFTRDPAELSFRHDQPTQTQTQAPTPTSTYGAIDASGQYAGMSPPGPQQVIIPYTTKQKPRPFEPVNWTPGWRLRPSQENELHEQQESKLVSTSAVTVAPPPNTRRTTKYLTKILASNLRELLKRERETKRRPAHFGVDISKLQHNIDGWTEQEYNSLSHRPSTPTIRGRSKHIPTEYLTTTTPATPTATSTALRQSKTTRSGVAGGFELGSGATSSLGNAGDLSTSINNLEQLHLRRFPPVEDNRLLPDYHESSHRTTPMPSATPTVTTTTPAPMAETTRDSITPLYMRTTASTPAPVELWKQAKVAILPQTNEKVYVVTPQPRHQPQHSELAASASVPAPVYQTPGPRFPRVRPTPAAATVTSDVMAATPTPATEQVRNYTPDIFGLMGLSAYVPAEPVEIIDGNSKIITIVTAAPSAAALQRPTPKSTISPRPR
ncbi:PREDICTED: ataxin-2 homolog [Drosophila arizonae]|uniref:Ataxin-2 homolog n=1 Tax=Drosophila arizonae TaxID=7263 RepID=A0ABM1PQG5_DROAR|nr:PREDICTED: ataxin-2 homolog [Drosophila arizonae]